MGVMAHSLVPFRHVLLGFAMAFVATAVLALACVAIPGILVHSRLRRAAA